MCVVKGLVLCPYCDTLKKRKCGAAACKEKAAMEAAEATRSAEDEGAGEGDEVDVDEDEAVGEIEATPLPWPNMARDYSCACIVYHRDLSLS